MAQGAGRRAQGAGQDCTITSLRQGPGWQNMTERQKAILLRQGFGG